LKDGISKSDFLCEVPSSPAARAKYSRAIFRFAGYLSARDLETCPSKCVGINGNDDNNRDTVRATEPLDTPIEPESIRRMKMKDRTERAVVDERSIDRENATSIPHSSLFYSRGAIDRYAFVFAAVFNATCRPRLVRVFALILERKKRRAIRDR